MPYSLLAGNIVMILTYLLKYTRLPPQIPLFYSKVWGEDQLADTWFILLIPIIMNIFYFLNIYLSKKFPVGDWFAHKVLHYLNIFVIVSLTLVFIKIILRVS